MRSIPRKAQYKKDEEQDADHPELEGEDLINYLESKLEQIEKNLVDSQKEYEQMQNECLDI